MARVLVVGMQPPDGAGADWVAVPSERVALNAVASEGRDVAAIVVGPDVEHPVAFAQRLGDADRAVPVIVVAGGEALARYREGLSVTPLLGDDVRVVPHATDVLVDTVHAAIDDAARRREHGRTMAALRSMPLTGITAPHRGATRYLGQLVEFAPIGIATVDPAGTIGAWNPRAAAITGRRERDALGSAIQTLFPPAVQPQLEVLLERGCKGEGAEVEVLSRTGPDGLDQHLEVTVGSLSEESALGCLVLLQDVTDRVTARRELEDRARYAELSAAVGLALTSNDSLDRKLDRCAQALVQHLGAALARVWTTDGDDLVLRASAGLYTHLDGGHSRVPIGQYKIGAIAADRRAHLTNHVLGDPKVHDQEWARREGLVSFAGYPLVVGDEVVGVMAMFSRRAMPESTLRALASVADAVAVGIEQTRGAQAIIDLLAREQAAREEAERAAERYASMAKTLQQSLLPPHLPDVPGLDLAARYHWAGDGSVVGGDFYDVFPVAGGRWGVVIGDVSGKGVEAAAVTAIARHTIRAAALDARGPAEVLHRLNTAILLHDVGDRFCTVALAFCALAGGAIDISLAIGGHPLPLVLDEDGAVRTVGAPGNPIGMFDDADVGEADFRLPPGSTMLLFTDGLLEARAPSGEFDPGLGAAVLGRCGGWSAHEVIAAMEASVLAFEGGLPRDDLALLALRAPSAGGDSPEPADVDVRVLPGTGIEARYPAQPEAVPDARARVRAWAGEWAAPEVVDDVVLATTELVTNAVRAARTGILLRVGLDDGVLTLEVRDDGYGLGTESAAGRDLPDSDAEFGRGLFLVRAVMDVCEVVAGTDGTIVRCTRRL